MGFWDKTLGDFGYGVHLAFLVVVVIVIVARFVPYIISLSNKVKFPGEAFTSPANKTGYSPIFGQVSVRSDMPETFANREPPIVWEAPTEFLDAVDKQGYGSYAEDLPRANVDAGILESHREYVNETSHVGTTGASYAVVRDDFMPAVQFMGLPRKAMYAQLGSDQSSRVTQSETPEQVIDLAQHVSTGYIL